MPYERLFNAPISEAAIISAAVGYAMLGGRAVPELMYCDFLGRAGDEVLNQLSKWQGMTAGQLRMPVLVRMGVGSKYGAQHSQDWSSLCAHVPGLKVIYPVTPYDTKGLMNAALMGTDPVMMAYEGYAQNFEAVAGDRIRVRRYTNVASVYEMPAEHLVPCRSFRWKQSHKGAGVAVQGVDGFAPVQMNLWTVDHLFSVESFHAVELAPGQTETWTRAWTFIRED